MKQEILIKEPSGVERNSEYVQLSIPCRKGELSQTDALVLVDHKGNQRPVQAKVLARWPDDSVKWIQIVFCLSLSAHDSISCFLETTDKGKQLPPEKITIEHNQRYFKVDTGSAIFTVPADVFAPFSSVCVNDDEVLAQGASCCQLTCHDDALLLPHIESFSWQDDGPLQATINLNGTFHPAGKMRFSACMQFRAGKSSVKIDFILHNPAAAKHPGGIWDLGESGAFLFKDFSFCFKQPIAEVVETCFAVSPDTPLTHHPAGSALTIYQESSGGIHWQSPVHRNRAGIVPLKQRGFIVEENRRELSSGLRATPTVWTGNQGAGITAHIPLFWQEFPKEISINPGELIVSLFPGRFPDLHELQPGERKTHVFYLDFSVDKNGLDWVSHPLQVTLPAQSYQESGIFTDLPGNKDVVDRFTSADELLSKREAIDEYGWRNFGDIFADHEAVYHQGDQPFISHYNNQYDLIAGAYRKFFITGDVRWRQLAADMAQHVLDIDLYHTDQDREEYNHGLFWHTEHYSNAGLSTHRSYSKEHKKTYDLYAGGGGPGAEHCYTTGLMLHYFQTGNPDFRQAVLDLAEWELLALSGPQTVLAALKRGMDAIKQLRTQSSNKKVFPYFPLTRGTGNAITACLDAYEVSHEPHWLKTVEYIIQRTLNPRDDIQCRDLLNAEISWSYTVLLAAVGKYLDKKRLMEQYDASFHYARKSLLAYAVWMADHEHPYLDKPEMLEYPNETWAAQDLRKAVVFYQASRYAETKEQAALFQQKAKFFYQYAANELFEHVTSRSTRPVTLMLQNGWVGERLQEEMVVPPSFGEKMPEIVGQRIPYFTARAVIKRFFWDLCRVLKCSNLNRELAWLRLRLSPPALPKN